MSRNDYQRIEREREVARLERIAARVTQPRALQASVDAALQEGRNVATFESLAVAQVCRQYGCLDLLPAMVGLPIGEVKRRCIETMWDRSFARARSMKVSDLR